MKFNILNGTVAVGGKSTVTQNPLKSMEVHHVSTHAIKGMSPSVNLSVQHFSGHVVKGWDSNKILQVQHVSAHVLKSFGHFGVHHVSAHVIYNGA